MDTVVTDTVLPGNGDCKYCGETGIIIRNERTDKRIVITHICSQCGAKQAVSVYKFSQPGEKNSVYRVPTKELIDEDKLLAEFHINPRDIFGV